MGRFRTVLALLGGVAVLAAPTVGGVPAAAADASDPAISVDGEEVSTRALVRELRTIAGNERYAEVLRKEDDEKLVPRKGTVNPIVAATWVNQRVNQLVVDREFQRLGLTVTPALRREAKRNVRTLFRGGRVFEAFPRWFRERLLERQARTEALEATFPATADPPEAELQDRFARTRPLCEGDKLVAQILVERKREMDEVVAALAAGAEYAALAREHSADPASAPNGGVFTCVGAPRYRASIPSIREAAEALPVGGVSEPIRLDGGYALVRVLPFTFENARPLLVEAWRADHPSPFGDFVREAVFASDLVVAERFATALRNRTTVGIVPRPSPVRL
jgi:hypothetical protein